MTIAAFIWKIERIIIRAKCSQCHHYNRDLETCCFFPCPNSFKGCHVDGNGNCMYYKKSGWL